MHGASNDPIEKLSQSELFGQIGAICAVVNVVVTKQELLESSLKKIMELFDAKRGSIFILDDNGKDLLLKVSYGMEINDNERMTKRLGEGVVGQVAASKKPIFVNDIGNDTRFKNYKARMSYSTPSFICSPLLIKDQLFGVINITDKGCGSRFSQNELQILDFLSSQIALNFRRIELYQKLRVVVKESEDLKDKLGETTRETSHLKKQIVAQEKLAMVGTLAGGVAHEFNNPLDGVIRYTNLCLEHLKDEDDVIRGYLLEIKNGLNRMAEIVRSLLACSRNITSPLLSRVDPNNVIERALREIKVDVVHKNIKVNKDLEQGMPEITDKGLDRIVVNLLRNAVDAIHDNGEIGVKSRVEDGDLIIVISDSGCGIDGEVEKIFEPFYTTKDIDKGCGLGLTIVGEIIKIYNGQIQVESEAGKGTIFTINIPME